MNANEAIAAAITRLDSIGCRASCAPNDDADTAEKELTRIMHDAYAMRDTLRAVVADPIGDALAYCNAQTGEFWQRLAGSLRKAATM